MKSRRRFSHQYRDRMLGLGASQPDIGGLRAGCLQLSLSLIEVGTGGRPSFKQQPGQLHRPCVVGDCLIEQRLLGVLSTQRK